MKQTNEAAEAETKTKTKTKSGGKPGLSVTLEDVSPELMRGTINSGL